MKAYMVTTEQYLGKQKKKGTQQLEVILMQTLPVEHSRVPRLQTAAPRSHVSLRKTTRYKGVKRYCYHY